MLGIIKTKKFIKACVKGHNNFFQVIEFYFYSFTLLLTRLMIASVFFKSGSEKFNNIDNAIFMFEYEYNIPFFSPVFATYLTTFSELIFSFFIAIGLFTRLVTLPLFTIALVIEFLVVENPQHLYWMMLLWLIFVKGAGSISLDRYLKIK